MSTDGSMTKIKKIILDLFNVKLMTALCLQKCEPE